jgi:hypothetical protein
MLVMHAINENLLRKMKIHANQEHTLHQAIMVGASPATRAIIALRQPHLLVNTSLARLENIHTPGAMIA